MARDNFESLKQIEELTYCSFTLANIFHANSGA